MNEICFFDGWASKKKQIGRSYSRIAMGSALLDVHQRFCQLILFLCIIGSFHWKLTHDVTRLVFSTIFQFSPLLLEIIRFDAHILPRG